jgi:hypothetical protein
MAPNATEFQCNDDDDDDFGQAEVFSDAESDVPGDEDDGFEKMSPQKVDRKGKMPIYMESSRQGFANSKSIDGNIKWVIANQFFVLTQ